jgi:hypothetical protein
MRRHRLITSGWKQTPGIAAWQSRRRAQNNAAALD